MLWPATVPPLCHRRPCQPTAIACCTQDDIPAIVAEAQAKFPATQCVIADPIGACLVSGGGACFMATEIRA